MHRYQTLVIGDQRVKITAIVQKLQDEIYLLHHRIASLKQQLAPNSGALMVYEDLLENRVCVLRWLNNSGETITAPINSVEPFKRVSEATH